MNPLLLSRFTATSCLGSGLAEMRDKLLATSGGLTPCTFDDVNLQTWVGEVRDVDQLTLDPALREFECRNNRLAQLGLQQDGFIDAVRDCANRYGERRIAVVLGTSTAGILSTEHAYRQRDANSGALPASFDYAGTHNVGSVAEYVRRATGLEGPACVVSSACSSSAKVFATATRMIDAGLIDAAVVGGVDSLCLTTLYGFNSLELLSAEACRPYDTERNGISIGEAAAFALLERMPADPRPGSVLLSGYGESSDAHHMSAPHPQGLGARVAMEAALRRASLGTDSIDYINLHGTATPSNDASEGHAVHDLFGRRVPANSTKGFTGHTLGAAGGLEAVICAIALQDGFLPGSVGTRTIDRTIDIDYQRELLRRAPRHVLSNSFGFGGTNASLILSRSDA